MMTTSNDQDVVVVVVADDDEEELEKELQQRAPRVLKHMNEDHDDSIKAYSLAFGEHPRCSKETSSAILTGLDRYGFLLQVTLNDGSVLEQVRVKYQGSVTCAKDLHKEAIYMHRLAYDKLGYKYKLVNGYYTQVVKMIGAKSTKTIKSNPIPFAVAAVAIVGGMALILHRRRRK